MPSGSPVIIGPRPQVLQLIRKAWEAPGASEPTNPYDSDLMKESGVAHVQIDAATAWIISSGAPATPALLQGALGASLLVVLVDPEEGVTPETSSFLKCFFALAPGVPVIVGLHTGSPEEDLNELVREEMQDLAGPDSSLKIVEIESIDAAMIGQAAGCYSSPLRTAVPAGLAISTVYERVKVDGKRREVTPIPFGLATARSDWSALQIVGGAADGTPVRLGDIRWFGGKSAAYEADFVSAPVAGATSSDLKGAYVGQAGCPRVSTVELGTLEADTRGSHVPITLVSPLWSVTATATDTGIVSLAEPVAFWPGPIAVLDKAGRLLAVTESIS